MTGFFGRFAGTRATDDTAPDRDGGPEPFVRPKLRIAETVPGRLVILAGPLLIALVLLQQFVVLPGFVEIFRKVVAGALAIGVVWLLVIMAIYGRREFLWRVRRKLFVSYLFLGFVPVVLMLAFGLASGIVIYMNLAGYVIHEGMDRLVADVTRVAEATGAELSADPRTASDVLEERLAAYASTYPALSVTVLPIPGETVAREEQAAEPIVLGPWRHSEPPAAVPAWLVVAQRFAGPVRLQADGIDDLGLVLRVAVPTRDRERVVIADLPVDTDIVARLDAERGTRIRSVAFDVGGAATVAPLDTAARVGPLFRQTVAFMDYTDWETGRTARMAVGLEAPVGTLYDRVAAVQPAQLTSSSGGLLGVMALLSALFVIIQGTALVGGVLLARSITSAVHELFVGTERVRSGNFAHRIRIDSKDQLGELAASFNRMSGSIEHLLHVQREKQRLDDELRIAREIQQSLLPDESPAIEGLSIAALCEPAREVGGDYYDFFRLGPRQLGVLVADVAGKGTSAGLYMAELKGLMIALSQRHRSPRQLLIEVNQMLAGHLDNRSFITMAYAVIDLDAGTLTYARGGHTPLIVVSGGQSDVVTPEGMVLGLQLPGADERFGELLAEHTRAIHTDDVFVLYTDGVTEAMDTEGELFGESALAGLVAGQQHLDAAGIRERVLRDVRAFVGQADTHDDMTMVIIKVTGAGLARRSA